MATNKGSVNTRFDSPEALAQATKGLAASLDHKGYHDEAHLLREGLSSLNGLTDGWALFLDAVKQVENQSKAVLTEAEKQVLDELHDVCFQAVYRRKRKAWWKFFTR